MKAEMARLHDAIDVLNEFGDVVYKLFPQSEHHELQRAFTHGNLCLHAACVPSKNRVVYRWANFLNKKIIMTGNNNLLGYLIVLFFQLAYGNYIQT